MGGLTSVSPACSRHRVVQQRIEPLQRLGYGVRRRTQHTRHVGHLDVQSLARTVRCAVFDQPDAGVGGFVDYRFAKCVHACRYLAGAERREQLFLVAWTERHGREIDQRRFAGGMELVQGVADLVQDRSRVVSKNVIRRTGAAVRG